MMSDMKPAAGGSAPGSQSPFTVENPIDPKDVVRVDALVLEKTAHPLQLAPFLLIVEADKSVKLQSCRASHAWNSEKPSVCSVLGTCPRLDENDDLQSHTIGFFAVNPFISSDLIIYIIDGKDQDDDDDKDYLECRNAAVDVFKT